MGRRRRRKRVRGRGGAGPWEWKMVCPGREGPRGEEVHATGDWESALKHRCVVEVVLVVGVGGGWGCSWGVVEVGVVVVGGVCSCEVDMGVEVVRKGMV